MSWGKMCKRLCSCRNRPPAPQPPVVVSVNPPHHRYTSTVVDIRQALATEPVTITIQPM